MTYRVATRFCTECGQSIEGFVGWIIYDTKLGETKYRHTICPPPVSTPLSRSRQASSSNLLVHV